MDTESLYATFTHPKVVTSMLLFGIGLGLALSVLMRLFLGQWYFPFLFAGLVLGTVIVYMAWLDRQEIRDGPEIGLPTMQGQEKGRSPVLIRPESPVAIPGSLSRFALFSDTRVIRSMLLLCIGLGFALCVVIILFRGTWYLPALIAALTIGTVAAYLCWLDGMDSSRD